MKKTAACVCLVLLAVIVVARAQKNPKPWNEWEMKDALKMLNDSAWGQTQVESSVSEMTYSPANQGPGAGTPRAQGALNQATSLNLRIRLLSAKPIRQALARKILQDQGRNRAQMETRLAGFVDRRLDPYVVVSVDYDSTDGRLSGSAMQIFTSAVASVIRNNTYLERKDGKRVFLLDYNPPTSDGLGAKFIFAREFEGQPWLNAESGEFRFYSEIGGSLKLNMRFKAADLTYDGALEY